MRFRFGRLSRRTAEMSPNQWFPFNVRPARSPYAEPNHHLSPHYNPKSISYEQPRGFPKQSDLLLASFAAMVSSSDNLFVLAGTKRSVRYPPYPLKAGYAVPSTRALRPLNRTAVAPSNRFHPVSYLSRPPQNDTVLKRADEAQEQVSTEMGSNFACHCETPQSLNSQHQPPTGRRKQAPGTSSMCPSTDF